MTHSSVGSRLTRSWPPARRNTLVEAEMPFVNHHHGRIARLRKST